MVNFFLRSNLNVVFANINILYTLLRLILSRQKVFFFTDKKQTMSLKSTLLLLFIAFYTPLFTQNLIKNADCELPPVNGKIPFWTEIVGNQWQPREADPIAQNGRYYFWAGQVKNAELKQIIDVTDYACAIDAGIQRFVFKGYVYSFAQDPQDIARIVLEFANSSGTILTTYDSNDQTPLTVWQLLNNTTLAPAFTRQIRVRLISTRRTGTDNDADYDNLSLTPNPAKLSIDTVKITPATCDLPNGRLEIKVTGGASVTFRLNNNGATTDSIFPNLIGGDYTIKAYSGNCTLTKAVILPTSVKPIIDSVKLTPSVCSRSNGKLTVFARSNIPNLIYAIDSGRIFRNKRFFDTLYAGVYHIIVKDTIGCVVRQSINLTDKPAPSIDSLQTTPSVCGLENGIVRVFRTNGGTFPLFYSLDNVNFNQIPFFNNLKSGNYTLIVRDSNSCTAQKNVIIQKFDAPILTNILTTEASCRDNDGRIKIHATGDAPPLKFSIDSVNFVKKDSFSSLNSGFYTVFVRDSLGCIAKQTVGISHAQSPIISRIKTSQSACNTPTGILVIEAQSGVNPLRYSIDNLNFQASNLFTSLSKGQYQLWVEDAKGCKSESVATIKGACGLYIPTAFSPNNDGNNDFLSIFGDEDDVDKIVNYRIFNRWGVLIYETATMVLNDIESGWDGHFKGQEVETGVYIYYTKVLLKDGSYIEQKGDVTLMR